MGVLPTDYLDDILAESMNEKRRFRITRSDGTFEEVVIEDISEYLQKGSSFGAGDVNRTNEAVNEKFEAANVVDPTLATELGFAADAHLTGEAISELNKKYAVVTSTTASTTNGSVEIQYPTGFSRDNCCIISFNSYKWARWYSEAVSVPSFGISVNLAAGYIELANADLDYGISTPVKIVLLKLS